MGRRISKLSMAALAAFVAVALLASPGSAATVITTFNPQIGDPVGIAWDPATGNVFVYAAFSDVINEFGPDGSAMDQGIPRPGNSSNDFDLDFALSDLSLAGKSVPANSLLVLNGDDSPATVYAIDKNSGQLVGTLPVQNVTPVGMAHHPSRGSLFIVDYSADVLVEVNPNDGSELSRFPVHVPDRDPYFDVFYGDVDVNPTTGNLFVVSSSQQVIRELSPTGAYVGDIDLTGLNVPQMAGIAFDSSGDAWISTLGGSIYKLGDLRSTKVPPECAQSGATCTGDDDDDVEGTSSADFIFTGGGNDSISSGAGNDTIDAGAGDDGIAAGAGADHVEGGDGDDTILGDSVGPTHLRAAAGNSNDVLDGGEGNDEVLGEAGADQLLGADGLDELFGGAGDDSLKGGDGKDILSGGNGTDILNGGPGNDTCVVTTKLEKRKARNCERFRRHL